jgi:hypothetical protein
MVWQRVRDHSAVGKATLRSCATSNINAIPLRCSSTTFRYYFRFWRLWRTGAPTRRGPSSYGSLSLKGMSARHAWQHARHLS